MVFPLVVAALILPPSTPIEPPQTFIERMVNTYPEIQWLADTSVKATSEGVASLEEGPSKALYGQKYIEFDRCMLSLRCLHWILSGTDAAWKEMTQLQSGKDKLTFEEFQELHRTLTTLGDQSEMVPLFETALILGDMGKTNTARELFQPHGVNDPDHDDFYTSALGVLKTHPELCPSFQKLSPSSQAFLIKATGLAHYGHIYHIEGKPNMFTSLKNSQVAKDKDVCALKFDFLVHIFDVAGALAHIKPNASLTLTDPTFINKQHV